MTIVPCLLDVTAGQRDGPRLDVIGRAAPLSTLEGLRLRTGAEQRPAARNNRDAMAVLGGVSQPEFTRKILTHSHAYLTRASPVLEEPRASPLRSVRGGTGTVRPARRRAVFVVQWSSVQFVGGFLPQTPGRAVGAPAERVRRVVVVGSYSVETRR